MADAVREFVDGQRAAFLESLVDWLRIPSVAADPAHADDVHRSAEWLAAALRETGFPTVEIWPTAGLPAVYAEWPAADPPGREAGSGKTAPVALVYGHHDVQPGDPVELWQTAPFEPVIDDDQLKARGAVDDKGQVLFHLLGLRALLAATGASAPPVTIKLLVEGEEEIGSPNFRALLKERHERLRCDVVVVSDTGIWDRDTPSMCTGMRGLVYCQLDVHGPDRDLHSGSFGGTVPNPATVLARILGGLHDDDGRVQLRGFYDSVRPLSKAERDLFARLPFDEHEWLATAGSHATAGEAGFTTLERAWARPTCEVNGFWSGYTGAGPKTIIPTSAHAKVSFRLVPDQNPAEVRAAWEAYIESAVPPGIVWTLEWFGEGVHPCLTPLDHPMTAATRRALERAFGQEVLITREGGSGPEADLAEVLMAPVVFLGVGLPDDRIHSPNERVVISQLLTGAAAAAYLWQELAAD